MRKIYTKGDSLLKNNSVLNKNEGGSFPYVKKCTLVVANKTTIQEYLLSRIYDLNRCIHV